MSELVRRTAASGDGAVAVSNPMLAAAYGMQDVQTQPAEVQRADTDPFGYVTHDGFWADARRNFYTALKSSLGNRYLLANIVYVVYAMMLLYLDYTLEPAYNSYATSSSSSSTDKSAEMQAAAEAAKRQLDLINRVYVGAASLHIVNAFMYIWQWWPLGYRWNDWVMIPEYLNVIEATLYLVTATYYPQTNDLFSPTTHMVHVVETCAAWVEMAAAIGWTITWWATYPRTIGRGLTLDDPDVWANILLVIPSVIYITYNLQILARPEEYGTNYIYMPGDVLYGAGAWMYVLGALRDDGWFWWMPLAGRLPYFPSPVDAGDIPCPPLPPADRTACAPPQCCFARTPRPPLSSGAPDHRSSAEATAAPAAGDGKPGLVGRRGDSERWGPD